MGKRKLKFIRRIMRNESLEIFILTRYIEDNSGPWKLKQIVLTWFIVAVFIYTPYKATNSIKR